MLFIPPPPSVRWIVYGVFLVLTGGKLKFWILPNLDNEKTGFLESFRPFHSVEWVKEKKKSKKSSQSTSGVSGEPTSASDETSLPELQAKAINGVKDEDEDTENAENDVSEPPTIAVDQ